jgi:hypothetical protein
MNHHVQFSIINDNSLAIWLVYLLLRSVASYKLQKPEEARIILSNKITNWRGQLICVVSALVIIVRATFTSMGGSWPQLARSSVEYDVLRPVFTLNSIFVSWAMKEQHSIWIHFYKLHNSLSIGAESAQLLNNSKRGSVFLNSTILTWIAIDNNEY